MLCVVHTFLIDFAVGGRKWSLDQDLANVNLLRRAKLIAVLIVIRLQFLLADLSLALKLGRINQHVLDFALLRNRVVVGRLVAIVESL